jgi:hypothetical protein
MSVIRMITSSSHPPVAPARMPSGTPMRALRASTPTTISSDVRAP